MDLVQYLCRCHVDRLPTERHIRRVAHQLLSALRYLHSENVYHRHLKPQQVRLFEVRPVVECKLMGCG